MSRIDLHAHVIPPAYLDGLRGPDGRAPQLPPATLDGLEAMMSSGNAAALVPRLAGGARHPAR